MSQPPLRLLALVGTLVQDVDAQLAQPILSTIVRLTAAIQMLPLLSILVLDASPELPAQMCDTRQLLVSALGARLAVDVDTRVWGITRETLAVRRTTNLPPQCAWTRCRRTRQ